MNLLKSEHPDRGTLFEYAEQLESGRLAFSSPTATHVRSCKRCMAEVEIMRHSLSLTTYASKSIEPTVALEASTILAMKSQRQAQRKLVRRRMAKSVSLAAVFLVAMSITLSSSSAPRQSAIAKVYPRAGQPYTPLSYEELLTESPEEQLLEPAFLQSNWHPASAWEKSQRRALEVLDELPRAH